MNLIDLKRKLSTGKALKMTFNSIGSKNAIIGKVRYIVKCQSNGIYLNEDKNATKGSFLSYPKASLILITDTGFKIFEAGKRDLNADELKILNEQPKDKKQDENDLMSDGNVMFYRRKQYFLEKGYFYLFGTKEDKGKRYSNNKILDDGIKGELSLEYEFC